MTLCAWHSACMGWEELPKACRPQFWRLSSGLVAWEEVIVIPRADCPACHPMPLPANPIYTYCPNSPYLPFCLGDRRYPPTPLPVFLMYDLEMGWNRQLCHTFPIWSWASDFAAQCAIPLCLGRHFIHSYGLWAGLGMRHLGAGLLGDPYSSRTAGRWLALALTGDGLWAWGDDRASSGWQLRLS